MESNLILENSKEKKIYLNQVKKSSIIIARKQGKIWGVILWMEDAWCCELVGECEWGAFENLTYLKEHKDFKDCKFSVIE